MNPRMPTEMASGTVGENMLADFTKVSTIDILVFDLLCCPAEGWCRLHLQTWISETSQRVQSTKSQSAEPTYIPVFCTECYRSESGATSLLNTYAIV
jgi:hypothetical protein